MSMSMEVGTRLLYAYPKPVLRPAGKISFEGSGGQDRGVVNVEAGFTLSDNRVHEVHLPWDDFPQSSQSIPTAVVIPTMTAFHWIITIIAITTPLLSLTLIVIAET